MQHIKELQRRVFSGMLSAALLLGGMTVPVFASEVPGGAGDDLLTYTVADGLNFDDTSVFPTSDEAWEYAETVVDHVEGEVKEMREIFARKTVAITDAKYGAESHDVFPVVEGTYKKSPEDAAAEAELAKKNTKAIYAAIKEVSEAGGGTVVVPAQDGKVFYTSAIHLEDNVNLHLEEGAELKFTTDTSLYVGDLMKEVYGEDVDELGLTLTRFEAVELMNYSPFIYAYGKKNIAITGKGKLDGQATTGDTKNPATMVWHQWKSSRTYTLPDGTTKKIEAQAAPRTQLFAQGQTNVPVAQRQYGESEHEDWSGAKDGFLRPNFIQPYNCQNVLIEGISVNNSPMWEINPVLCDTVLVQDVTIYSHLHNNDGVDPECTSNIVIQNNHIDTGDDCIAIKSGRNGDGLRVSRSSFNIVIQNNVFVDGHGGVTIGSEITNGVKNIFARNNEMNSDHLQAAYRFKTNYIRGGVIENIYYQNDIVKMVENKRPVILVDLNYDIKKEVQMMKDMNVSYQAYSPAFKHVLFEGMQVNLAGAANSGGQYAMQLKGFDAKDIDASCTVPEGMEDCYITDFTIKDSTFVGSQQAFNMVNVDGLTLENVTIRGTTSEDSVKNCKNLVFKGCDFHEANVKRETFESISKLIEDTIFKGETRPVTGIELDPDELELTVGETVVITPVFKPANATNKSIVWQSDNEDVTSVVNGEVTANAAGEAIITATTEDGGFTAECAVTVLTELSVVVESDNESDFLTADIDESLGRISLVGIAAEPERERTLTLTFTLPDGGTQEEEVTLVYEDGKLTVEPDEIEIDGVNYRLDVNQIILSDVKVIADDPVPSIDGDLELDEEEEEAVRDALASLDIDTKRIAGEAAKELVEACEGIEVDDYDGVTAVVYLKVDVIGYTAPSAGEQPSLKLDITPIYKVIGSKESSEHVLKDESRLETNHFSAVKISINLPDGFVRSVNDLVKVKHYDARGFIKEWLPVTLLRNGNNFTARFTATSFSEYELVANLPQVSVVYNKSSGEVVSVNYDPSKIGEKLVTDSRSGYNFLGWSTVVNSSRAEFTGTLTEAMLEELCKATEDMDGPLNLYPVFQKRSSGGSSRPYRPSTSGTTTQTKLRVDVESGKNGSVSISPHNPAKGDVVTITVIPDDGYRLDMIEATDGKSREVNLTDKGDGVYTFTMPSTNVTVKTIFKLDDTIPQSETEAPKASYWDVNADDWFQSAVDYVTAQGIMAGSNGSFSPNDSLTRGMMAQILYNMEDASGGDGHSFPDVQAADWFATSVRWVASQSLMDGYGNGNFGPNDFITREQVAAILYRYAQGKGYAVATTADLSVYADGRDASDWAEPAVRWAVGSGLLSGKSGNRLDPIGTATRAEIAQIMMSFFQNIK